MPQPFVLDDGRVLLERDVGVVVRDGTRLSVDLYRPNRPGRFPAVFEHIPYRKDDLRSIQDRSQNIFLVNAGFACVRLDVRGTGSSQGIACDEYTQSEQHDGFDVVEWMGRQPWCTGAVAAWGVSYGGFTCIQLAALQPPALRAIAPVYATDDRYTDDMHYDGGALNASSLPAYPTEMIAMNSLPPLGERDAAFDAAWLRRIEDTPAWVVAWIREQGDGPYWRSGSLRPDYGRITCPVLIVAGWRDGYRSAAVRMADRLGAPWQLLAGPWAHVLPDRGRPEPIYPFLAEMARFFHRHLGGDATGAERPRSVFWLGGHDSPARPHVRVSGEWLSSASWPARSSAATLRIGGPAVAPRSVTVGVMTGQWCPPPPAHGQFLDQRRDDARSACFDTAPLREEVAVLGIPVARFGIRHPGPVTIVSVKLNDVAPDGSSAAVTRGAVRLAPRGETAVAVELLATGWRFEPGHRIRVAVAVNDWPHLWPLPTVEPLRVTSPVELELPAVPADARPFSPPSDPPVVLDGRGARTSGRSSWRVLEDVMTGASGIETTVTDHSEIPAEGMRCEDSGRRVAMAREDDPLSATVWGYRRFRLRRPGLDVVTRADARFRATPEDFLVDLRLGVSAGGQPFADRRWHERIPRVGA
jgi:predicted acyl esterase